MALTKVDDRGLKTPIDLLDNEKIRLGTGNDLEIYHDGSHSYLKDAGTGTLRIEASEVGILSADGSETMAQFVENGAASLRHNNSTKFATTASGVDVTGNCTITGHFRGNDNVSLKLGNGDDLQLYHDGSDDRIMSGSTNSMIIASKYLRLMNQAANETMAKFTENGAAELYYDNSKKIETTSAGTTTSGVSTTTDGNGSVNIGGNYLLLERTSGTTNYLNAPNADAELYISADEAIRFGTVHTGDFNSTERMRINSGGRVDIGDSLGTAHSGYFQVIHEGGNNQANDCLAYFESNANDWCIITNSNEGGSAAHHHLYFYEEGTTRGSIGGSHGSNVNYNQGSDYRWKENIVDMTGAEGIEICKKLKPRKYNWIKNREGTGKLNTVDGFIAHEVVEAGVLGAVTGEKDAVKEDGSIDGQLLDYGQMTPVLAAGIKGLIAKVETLETKVAALEAA